MLWSLSKKAITRRRLRLSVRITDWHRSIVRAISSFPSNCARKVEVEVVKNIHLVEDTSQLDAGKYVWDWSYDDGNTHDDSQTYIGLVAGTYGWGILIGWASRA